jgi:hypothetical protein
LFRKSQKKLLLAAGTQPASGGAGGAGGEGGEGGGGGARGGGEQGKMEEGNSQMPLRVATQSWALQP